MHRFKLPASIVAFACAIVPSLTDAQAGFHQVAPTGSYLTTSPFDNAANPLIIDLTGLGSAINLTPSGILRVAGFYSPDHQAGFCGIFASTNALLPQSQPSRVTTAIGPIAATPCTTRPTFYFGIPTDVAEDFLIPETGLTVGIPNGANFLMIAVPDDQYADNVTPDQSTYGITVSSVVPEPSTYALMALGMIGIGAMKRRSSKRATR